MMSFRFYLSLICLLSLNESVAFMTNIARSGVPFRYRKQRIQQQPSFPGRPPLMRLHQNKDDDVPSQLESLSSQIPQLPLSSSLSTSISNKSQKLQTHDIVIVGGGLAGLSAALYVSQMDPSRRITILDRETSDGSGNGKTSVASMAAAGMLAPHSERLPLGPLLDICLASRRMFADFCQVVESLAQQTTKDFWSHLDTHVPLNQRHVQSQQQQQPWNVGYVASGGFLAPAFAGDSVATWAPPSEVAVNAVWLDAIQIREMEPHLHPNVVGGWWFPEDASVDARRLTCSLRAACHVSGVEQCQGRDYEVTSLDLVDGSCRGIWLKNGQYIRPSKVLIANGAWMRQLLPVPIEPHKGQSLSLRMPSDRPPILRRVLFAQDSYLVPKADGRIIVGATVEAGSFDPNVTPAGLMHILSYALQLVPGLADLPIEETWAGLRPTTPDKGPILGKTPWDNLFLAAGYWRNGVLLAPKTGQLVASILLGQSLPLEDQALVNAFSWDRFTSARGGAKLAAEARLAAAMHPIHSRVSGPGVAAAVGTELGSYSVARSASSEREQDRAALLWSDSDDALERAALLGKQDAAAYSFFGQSNIDDLTDDTRSNVQSPPLTTTRFEGTPDAFTVGSSNTAHEEGDDTETESSSSSSSPRDLNVLYEKIQMSKTARNVVMHDPVEEERPDPGFRIYKVDSVTGKLIEVAPFTSLDSNQPAVTEMADTPVSVPGGVATSEQLPESDDGDSIFDGYQAIQAASDSTTKSDDDARVVAMRKSRLENRLGSIGEERFVSSQPSLAATAVNGHKGQSDLDDDNNLLDIYETIRKNKLDTKSNLEMEDPQPDDRPDPGFRIFHVDSETGRPQEVRPYTSLDDLPRRPVTRQEQHMMSSSPSQSDEVASDSMTANGSSYGTMHPNGDDDHKTNNDLYDEKTLDGYQTIHEAYESKAENDDDDRHKQAEQDALREIRRRNRLGQTDIDISKIGAQQPPDVS